MKEELLKGLTEEQIAKIKGCKSQKEILALAKEEGIELTDEQLEAVSGGCFTTPRCPSCGSDRVEEYYSIITNRETGAVTHKGEYKKCASCGYKWDETWEF